MLAFKEGMAKKLYFAHLKHAASTNIIFVHTYYFA